MRLPAPRNTVLAGGRHSPLATPVLPNPGHFPIQPSAFSTPVLSCWEAAENTALSESWQHCQGVSANLSCLHHRPSFLWPSRSLLPLPLPSRTIPVLHPPQALSHQPSTPSLSIGNWFPWVLPFLLQLNLSSTSSGIEFFSPGGRPTSSCPLDPLLSACPGVCP